MYFYSLCFLRLPNLPALAQIPARRTRPTLTRRTSQAVRKLREPSNPAHPPTTRLPLAPGVHGPAPRRRRGCQGARAGLLEGAQKGARPRLPLPQLSPRKLGTRRPVVVMASPWDELTLAFSRTSMFPFFDIAHYLVSVMALKRQPGECGALRTGPRRVPSTVRTARAR